MPRYFFHTADGQTLVDEDGSELDGPDAASMHAVTLMGELLREFSDRFWNDTSLKVTVTDEAGLIVCVIDTIGTRAPSAVPADQARHASDQHAP